MNIPAYNWWNEALHGVGRAGIATVFPQAIGMAAMFDDVFLKKIAAVISDEVRAKYNEAVREDDTSLRNRSPENVRNLWMMLFHQKELVPRASPAGVPISIFSVTRAGDGGMKLMVKIRS